MIEHNGATVGMITTEGYRDILHIARHKKPLNFSNYQDLPWQRYPLVRRRYRLTVPERITGDGEVLVPLDEERRARAGPPPQGDGRRSRRRLLPVLVPERRARARVAEIVREEFPDAFLSVSSDVLPQYREYERFSTVALNAFVGPKVAGYVRRLEDELRGLGVRTGLHLMSSASGVVTAQGAVERPVNLLMSGPVAGVVGGIWVGRQAGFENVITLDVGGTSADIGLSQGGKLRMKHLLDTRVGPYQAMIPMVDVDTIGAGGGSIAYVDGGGIFRSGPRSAGAVPGPGRLRPRRHRADRPPTRWSTSAGSSRRTSSAAAMELDPSWRGGRSRPWPRRSGMSVEEASMGAIQIASALDGPVDRGELGAQGL